MARRVAGPKWGRTLPKRARSARVTANLRGVTRTRDAGAYAMLCGAPNTRLLETEFIINGNINDKWQYKWPPAGNASPFHVGWFRS
jgi:hypothetical protein